MAKITSLFLAFAIIGVVFSAPSGEAEDDNQDRILNGRASRPNSHPYVASVQWRHNSEPGTLVRSKFCGASIIDKHWCVTAAHCIVNDESDGVMHINAGVIDAFDQTGQYIPVSKIFYPGQYNKTGHEEHDIALLKLSQPLKYNAAVQPIKLPSKGETPKGVGTICGWGAINEDHSKSSNKLLEADIPVADSKECRIFAGFNSAQQICLRGGNASACGGDSGGPFSIGKVLFGVTSYGTVKCTPDKPVVYTLVSAYSDWISSTMAAN